MAKNKSTKTGFAGSILVTLKVMVVSILLGVIVYLIRFLLDETNRGWELGLIGLWSLVCLWLFGLLCNRFWGWK